MVFRRKLVFTSLFAIALIASSALAWLWLTRGMYGINAVLRRGGSYWISMEPDDLRLTNSMRLALVDNPPNATPGAIIWNEAELGFEVGEMPVLINGTEVDRILLNRIDPQKFRFIVRNAPDGDKDIDQWEQALPNDVLIVNGSFFDQKGFPDTPIISEGVAAGPRDYDARAGAFVDFDGTARLVDLADRDWRKELSGATNAMVSYSMLIGDDGRPRAGPDSRWLSNRTFLGQDRNGHILVGTTKEAFFSLARLATFLKAAPLDLKLALNLDGGPIACQSVRLRGFRRKFYAQWESQFRAGKVSLLRSPFMTPHWAMPMALTVERR